MGKQSLHRPLLARPKFCDRCRALSRNFINDSYSSCRFCLTDDEINAYVRGEWGEVLKDATKKEKQRAFKSLGKEHLEKMRREAMT